MGQIGNLVVKEFDQILQDSNLSLIKSTDTPGYQGAIHIVQGAWQQHAWPHFQILACGSG